MLRNIVIDIEMLLDTRYGTLMRTVPDEALNVVNSTEYRFREHEDIWKFTSMEKERWDKAWELRDLVTLSKSLMTLLVADFPSFIADLNSVVKGNNPGLSDVRFLINTYPYKINESAKIRLLEVLQEQFSTTCEIRTVNLPWSKLAPYLCKSKNIIQLFVYDFSEYCRQCFPDNGGWSEENIPTPNEELSIITPRISRDYFGDTTEIDSLGVELPMGQTPFTITKELMDLICNLEFISTNHVCAVTPKVVEIIKRGKENDNSSNIGECNGGDTTITSDN